MAIKLRVPAVFDYSSKYSCIRGDKRNSTFSYLFTVERTSNGSSLTPGLMVEEMVIERK
jgi:hypothetical protein